MRYWKEKSRMNENEYKLQLEQCESELKNRYRDLRNQILQIAKTARRETGTLKSFFVPCGIFTGIAFVVFLFGLILSVTPAIALAGILLIVSFLIFVTGLVIAGASVSDASVLREPIEKNGKRLINYVNDIGDI